MTVGEKIRKYRTEQGLLQKDLAAKCKMSESAIRNYELGNRIGENGCATIYELGNRTPKPHHLEVIATALGISPYALLDPDLDSEISLMHALFYLEDKYGLQVVKEEGITYMNFDVSSTTSRSMQGRLVDWVDAKGELTEEEYIHWKDTYPAKATKNKR